MKRSWGVVLSAVTLAACGSIEDLVPKTVDQDPSLPQMEIEVVGVRRKIHQQTFGSTANPVVPVRLKLSGIG